MGDPRPDSRPVVFGCPVDPITMDDAVTRVDAMIQAGVPARVGAINAAKLVAMETDPDLDRAVRASEIILADGIGVVWAVWLLSGVRLGRVTGIDLMGRLMDLAARKEYGIFLLGARQEVIDELHRKLPARYPGLRIAGSRNGYFGPGDEPGIVESIRASGASILFVAMGTPAKELWIDRHLTAMGVPVAMGVGGSFDVFSGFVKRAPVWMQRTGLEWFYRFAQEPRRLWRRYFVTSVRFFFQVLGQAVRRPFTRHEAR